jgi:1-deoxy-D-xylulose-5-phosphate synthase
LDVAGHVKHVVTVEENVLNGGFGSGVLNLLEKSGMCDLQVACVGVPDEFVEHGSQAILRAKFGLDAQGITRKVSSMFLGRSPGLSADLENKAKTS